MHECAPGAGETGLDRRSTDILPCWRPQDSTSCRSVRQTAALCALGLLAGFTPWPALACGSPPSWMYCLRHCSAPKASLHRAWACKGGVMAGRRNFWAVMAGGRGTEACRHCRRCAQPPAHPETLSKLVQTSGWRQPGAGLLDVSLVAAAAAAATPATCCGGNPGGWRTSVICQYFISSRMQHAPLPPPAQAASQPAQTLHSAFKASL